MQYHINMYVVALYIDLAWGWIRILSYRFIVVLELSNSRLEIFGDFMYIIF
jgi:hypothetical protein